MYRIRRNIAVFLIVSLAFSGCVTYHKPYVGKRSDNPQFERGRPFLPLDLFGHFISLPFDLLFWTIKYGNHNISPETEAAVDAFIKFHQMEDVKVRMNQWAPHKEIGRLIINPHIAWPYKIFFFPSTLIVSLIARPFSGFLISDYYDPGSNTINIFSDEVSIALHELGHAKDFSLQDYKGMYAVSRLLPFVALFQEQEATDYAIHYYQEKGMVEDELKAYHILYPAYFSYIGGNLPVYPVGYVTAIFAGHFYGRSIARERAKLYRDVSLESTKPPPLLSIGD